jgi:uncharacterized glyoxalase superfamily protein PhnB
MAGQSQVVTPYLCCRDAARALEFYAKAFGARELVRYTAKDGPIGHAEIEIEGGRIMLSDEWPEGGVFSPEKYGGTTFAIRLVVKDVDAVAARAAAAGATAGCAIRSATAGRWRHPSKRSPPRSFAAGWATAS